MRLFSLLTLFLTVLSLGVYSNEKKKLMEEAEHAFYDQNYQKAYECYDKLETLVPSAKSYYSYRKGVCLVELKRSPEVALQLLEANKADFDSSDIADEYFYYLARACHLNLRFDDAILYYQKSLEIHGSEDTYYTEVINRDVQLSNNARKEYQINQNYEVKNVGNILNSEFPEYKPVISADESSLMFTSRRSDVTGQEKDVDGKYFEDIYISERDKYGYWEQPVKLNANVNTPDHEASVGLSADGRKLLFYQGGKHSGSLYTSFLEGDAWGTPILIDDGTRINSKKFWETSASMNLDETEIYFTSDRKGGLGGLDIYKSVKLPNGDWGNPIPLVDINSTFDEESPFIHPDGRTLYFASNNNNSIGGFDIFKSVFEDGKWSTPLNMGYPINTVFDDLYFTLTADGKKAYFSSSRSGGSGAEDLFSVVLDEDVRPLVLIKGIVRSELDEEIIASIDVYGKEDNKKQRYIYNPNRKTGRYLMILPPNKSYNMVVSAEGYDNFQLDLDIPDQEHFHEFYQEIILKKTKSGDSLLAEEIVVVNSFDDLRNSSKIDPKLKQADPDYLKDLVQDIANLTDSSDKKPEVEAMLAEKLGTVTEITEGVTGEYEKVVDNQAYTEAITYKSEKNSGSKKDLQPMILGDDTVMAVPYSKFNETDLSKKEATQESSDIALQESKSQATDKNSDETTSVVKPASNQESKPTIAPSEESLTKISEEEIASLSEIKLPEDVVIYFDFNSSALKEEYKPKLKSMVESIKNQKNIQLIIEGHTDAVGSDQYNDILSQRRSNTVSNYLQNFFPKQRIFVEFFGEAKPAAPNVNPDGSDNSNGRVLNRRAVVKAKLK